MVSQMFLSGMSDDDDETNRKAVPPAATPFLDNMVAVVMDILRYV
jgi:hypothetical protein